MSQCFCHTSCQLFRIFDVGHDMPNYILFTILCCLFSVNRIERDPDVVRRPSRLHTMFPAQHRRVGSMRVLVGSVSSLCSLFARTSVVICDLLQPDEHCQNCKSL